MWPVSPGETQIFMPLCIFGLDLSILPDEAYMFHGFIYKEMGFELTKM